MNKCRKTLADKIADTIRTDIDSFGLYKDDWDIPCNETSDAECLCKNPTVSIITFTYNHEKFIAQAIEGMAMQETDFEYEILLVEDCSQDRTRDICFEYQAKYPDRIRVLWAEKNLYGYNTRRARVRCRGKYIAFCEGDDYWTDPKKLQKQVEYMEGHPGCAGCFHERVRCDENGNIIPHSELPQTMKRPLHFGDLAIWTFPTPPTCTVMWRTQVMKDRPAWMNSMPYGDDCNARWGSYAHGSVDWVEGVRPSFYRTHPGGVWTQRSGTKQFEGVYLIDCGVLEHFRVAALIRRKMLRNWAKIMFGLKLYYQMHPWSEEDQRLWKEMHRDAGRRGLAYRSAYRMAVAGHAFGTAIEEAKKGILACLRAVVPPRGRRHLRRIFGCLPREE